jgi:hypothetical protein
MVVEFPAIVFHLALEDSAEAVGKMALDKFYTGNPGQDAD